MGGRNKQGFGDTNEMQVLSPALLQSFNDDVRLSFPDTRARPPSRTLMDPLTAFVHELPQGLQAGVRAAKAAADATKEMTAKAGRAVYVDQKQLAESGTPDPGAWGVAVIVEAVAYE